MTAELSMDRAAVLERMAQAIHAHYGRSEPWETIKQRAASGERLCEVWERLLKRKQRAAEVVLGDSCLMEHIARQDEAIAVRTSEVDYLDGELKRLQAELRRLRESSNFLIGYALTSRSESQEWLQGMAGAINRTADALGDSNRAEAARGYLVIRRAASHPPADEVRA